MSDLIKELLNGNTALITGAIVVLWKFQKEAMAKLDEVVQTNREIRDTVIEHTVKFTHSDKEFEEIAAHQMKQDEWIMELKDAMGRLTKEHK